MPPIEDSGAGDRCIGLGMSSRFAPRETLRILLISDDPLSAGLAVGGPDDGGATFGVVRVDTLADACAALAESAPDCIVLDLGLPDADGVERLHELERIVPSVPLVVLTGSRENALAVIPIRGGAHDYLTEGRVDGGAVAHAIRHAIERKRVEAELAYRALHDPLTGLPNRALFFERLRFARGRLGDGAGGIALVFGDLDGFKAINDAAGHIAGDAVLVEVARRLESSTNTGDVVARFGGDEFAVVCAGVADATDVDDVAARLVAAITEPPIEVKGRRVALSVGTAWTDDRTVDPDELVRQADAAMYRTKRATADGTRRTRRHSRPLVAYRDPRMRQLFEFAAPALAELFGDTCMASLLSGDGRWLDALGVADPDPEVTAVLRELLGRSLSVDAIFAKQALTTGTSVRIPATSSQVLVRMRPELVGYAQRVDVRSMAELPMRCHGQVLGLLTILRRREEPLTADEERFGQFVADLLAVALATIAAAPPAPSRPGSAVRPRDELSARERDILALLARGYTNRDIAARLMLSVRTVEWYRARIQLKLGVRGRPALADAARSSGLIE